MAQFRHFFSSQFNFFSSQEYEAKLEERQKAEKLKFRSKIEEKINAFLKDDKSKTLKFPAMDKFQRWVAFGLLNGVVLCMIDEAP